MNRLASLLISAVVASVSAASAADNALQCKAEKDSIAVSHGARKVLVYRATETPRKCYVQELCTPGGVQVLRDSPHDHVHHHALMFAIKADDVDFWSETAKCGFQRGRKTECTAAAATQGIAQATISQDLDLTPAESDAALLREKRTVTVFGGADLPATLLTWRTRLTPAEGNASVKLGGSHYFGLGMRFVTSMDEDGTFFAADEKDRENVRGTEFLTKTKWMAYTAKADGKPVTVALFDSPKNPRHPARMFTMTKSFAYLAATLNLWQEPIELKQGDTLDVSYGVALWDGTIEPKQVEELYQRWVKEGAGKVEVGGASR